MESVDQTLSKIIIMGRSQLNSRKSLTAMKEENSNNNAPKSKTRVTIERNVQSLQICVIFVH
jgi:hypothetical protein